LGATLQRRGGTARHDKVAWAYATRASELGVDIVEHCEVTGFLRGAGGRAEGVRTTRGDIAAGKVGLVAAGHTSVLAEMVGLRLPVQSHPLQALVSVLLEPVLGCVVMSNAVHVYVSQADKGELVMGAGIDPYNGYAQRGSFHVIEHQLAAAIELFPVFAHAKLLRTWGGIVDVCPDASPILSRTPIENLYLNCGWGTGGFKATPGSGWVFADLVARGEPGPLARPYALERFMTGALIDEHGAAGVAH
jgi:sarcosine oxidase subunit beta